MSNFVAAAVPRELREQFPNAEWLSVQWAERGCITIDAVVEGKERRASVGYHWGDMVDDTLISDLAGQLSA